MDKDTRASLLNYIPALINGFGIMIYFIQFNYRVDTVTLLITLGIKSGLQQIQFGFLSSLSYHGLYQN